VKRFDELRRFYEANLAELRASLTVRTEVATAPAPPPLCDNETLSCALEQVTPTP
jgi:hypothetical protein